MGLKTEIEKTLEILSEGGIILYPTDTIWGIGCDATLSEAVEKIFQIKKREEQKSMLVLMDSIGMLSEYVVQIPEMAREILSVSEEPITIVYPGARGLAKNLLDRNGSVGIRITSDPFCHGLLQAFGKPIVSTSANVTGKTGPSSFKQIDGSIIDSVDYCVNWRRDDNRKRRPSGILKVGLKGEIKVIRQ